MERSIAPNIDKSVEVGAKRTEIWTSLVEVPLQYCCYLKDHTGVLGELGPQLVY